MDSLAPWQKSLLEFVPQGCFDAHAHLYRAQDANPGMPDTTVDAQGNASYAAYDSALARWMGDKRPRDGLFFTFPSKGVEMATANDYLRDQVATRPESRALMLIHPKDDPAKVEATVARDGYVGFKVYHVYSSRSDSFNAELEQFLPDWAWDIAHRRSLAIMLHIVRERALADPHNQKYLVDRCLRFPGAKLILAHAARGFCGQHTIEGIHCLQGLDNVWFDTSAIAESEPYSVILAACGPSRLLFGLDFPVCEFIGRPISVADGFLWLDPKNVTWETSQFAQPVRVGWESLKALREACRQQHLNDGDVEQIFGRAARQMLGITPPSEGRKVQTLYERAKEIIPGGTQLLSKRPEMFAPQRWPAYYREAHGCEIIDVEGRRFIDMTSSGIGSCLLGYADPDVTAAVQRQVALGSMCSLNPAAEVELAELLIKLHPWAEQARFCRAGGEALSIAVRLARAATGRDRIAFCGYHGWTDWYLAANVPEPGVQVQSDQLVGHLLPGLEPAGVPSALGGTALPFSYGKLDQLEEIIRKHGNQLAAVVMEPTRSAPPPEDFLQGVRELCDRAGLLLVFDEVTTGWRMAIGGVHMALGVEPDLAVFAKALGNGHPIAAVIGRRRAMQEAQRSFISSTYWTEAVGPTAALATIRKLHQVHAPSHVHKVGGRMRVEWQELGKRHGVPSRATGYSELLQLGFEHEQALLLGTLFTARMLDRGFLAGSMFYPSFAHHVRHVDAFVAAAHDVFVELAEGLAAGDLAARLQTPVRHSGFARLT